MIDKKNGQIKSKQLIANPHVEAEHKRGYLTGKFLLGLKPDQVIVSEKKEGTAVALLEEAGVEIINRQSKLFLREPLKKSGNGYDKGNIIFLCCRLS